jgi:hypothetical protein
VEKPSECGFEPLFPLDFADFDRSDPVTNPRGIPTAPFVDKVEDYVNSRAEVERTIKNFQEMISSVAQ